jgi:hypothetical protein
MSFCTGNLLKSMDESDRYSPFPPQFTKLADFGAIRENFVACLGDQNRVLKLS